MDARQYNNNMTIAQQLKIKEFPFIIKDSKGKEIYFENSEGYWSKCEWDSKGNTIYFGDSYGYWAKRKYDSEGNRIYYENSYGAIHDNRPKTEIQKAIELLTKEGLVVDGKILKN
jgi:hypothetical protein